MKVTIEVTYNPPSDFTLPSPPYYRPGTAVTLTCQAHDATGGVRYQWFSTCASCFASSSTAQSVSETILKSINAGVHTCTVTDGNGNTGSSSTEMKLIGMKVVQTVVMYVHNFQYYYYTGAGFYVDESNYLNNVAVANNSLIVTRHSRVDVHCYSNSTSTNIGYYIFPDSVSQYRSSYHSYNIYRQTNSGVRLYSYNTNIWGIFTCEIPDSEGNNVETSIGIYSSMPFKLTRKISL